MKKVRAVYRAGFTDYDGLDTFRVMPTRNLPIEILEPFIFLNHHGPQVFPAGNSGLPFGPHPHKGFETVTLILEGDLVHKDSSGYSSNIKEGGVQWMTAGKGIIHSEQSSDEFKEKGGPVEILQLWVNLPSHLKETEPSYIGLQKNEIPTIEVNEQVTVKLISGSWENEKAPIQSISHIDLFLLDMKKDGSLVVDVSAERTVLFYVLRGNVTVNGTDAQTNEIVEFEHDGDTISMESNEDTLILFAHAIPSNEPLAANGPFVMNTPAEIRQAYVDYNEGKFGVWQH